MTLGKNMEAAIAYMSLKLEAPEQSSEFQIPNESLTWKYAGWKFEIFIGSMLVTGQ